MTSLAQRLLSKSTIDAASILDKSMLVNDATVVPTPIPALNIALSGSPNGGLMSGVTIFAGPSKHFKSLYSLLCAVSYMKQYPDAVCLFYDNEFGSPISYFQSVGIDPSRVVWSPIMDWEDLIHDAANQLQEIKRGDRVVIVIDSIGNLASKKEVDDAISGSDAADMTRAKRAKSFFRIVTPHLTMKDIPMLVVAHTYDTLEMFSKKTVSGGTGPYYSANNIFIVGREQDKKGTGASAELLGYDFKLNVEKSRLVREKSKIPITVRFDGGIQKWSGLFDIAIDIGVIEKVAGTKSDHRVIDDETFGVFTRKKMEHNAQFWKYLLGQPFFVRKVEQEFRISSGALLSDDNDNVEDTEDESSGE